MPAIVVGGPRCAASPLLRDSVIVPAVVGVHLIVAGFPAVRVPSIGTIGFSKEVAEIAALTSAPIAATRKALKRILLLYCSKEHYL
jgi:hypothetical protein